jgi:hypothetical protein
MHLRNGDIWTPDNDVTFEVVDLLESVSWFFSRVPVHNEPQWARFPIRNHEWKVVIVIGGWGVDGWRNKGVLKVVHRFKDWDLRLRL